MMSWIVGAFGEGRAGGHHGGGGGRGEWGWWCIFHLQGFQIYDYLKSL